MEVTVLFSGTKSVFGLRLTVGPEAELDANRLTWPLKPLTLVMLMVDVPVAFGWKISEAGLAETLNPTTFTLTVSVWDRSPLVSSMAIEYVPAGVTGFVATLSVVLALPPADSCNSAGARLTARLLGAFGTLAASFSSPEKPNWLVSLRV